MFAPLALFLHRETAMFCGRILAILMLLVPFVSCRDAADRSPQSRLSSRPPGQAVAEPPGIDDEGDPDEDESHADLILQAPSAAVSSNPVEVRGRARTFENNVVIQVRDARGELIATTFTTAAGEMGTLNPFATEVWIPRDPGSRITIELIEHSARDGSLRARTSRTLPWEGRTVSETLWFPIQNPGNDCTRVVPVNRDIPAATGRLRALMEALIAGPSNAEQNEYGASAVFPRGARIEGVNLRGALAVVDLNERMTSVGGSCRAQAIRSSIEKTLTNLEGVDRVEIRAEGSPETALQP